MVTRTMGQGSPPRAPRDGIGLTPGTVLLRRYRIINLLGRGGMAEVYRADDLRLGEEVALKFLSPAAMANEKLIGRLHDEVRNGRKVAHPNVCRIYDIVEAKGRHFISMEYVAGEDLASLLRQHGRFEHENALRISRDLCAGVAAAHDIGLLHRDLKPANVMIDRVGSPKISDFGIAAFANEIQDGELSGTLNYMAPELFGGGGPSFSSDIYSVGCILHELFTGRPAFDADSIQHLIDAQRMTRPSPSSLAPGLDEAVTRVIVKCLANEPSERPRTAREIVAMLPGPDRIDAAVTAGETLSPEDIAYIDVHSTLSGRRAALLLGAAVCGFLAIMALTPLTVFYAQVPLEKPPDVLLEKAQQVATNIGMPIAGLRDYSWFQRDEQYLRSRPASRNSSWLDLRSVIPGVMEYVTYWAPPSLTPQNSTGRIALESSALLNGLNSVVLD
jgi:serine/threonine protein kinase